MGRRRIELPPEVGELRSRIEAWRVSRESPRSRMPEDFWGEAVAFARSSGVSSVSRALGIGYMGLRQRLGEADGLEGGTEVQSNGFVELSAWPGGSPMLVEADRADGCRLRLQVHPGAGSDAATVLRAFLVAG